MQERKTVIWFNALRHKIGGADTHVERLAIRVKYIAFVQAGGRKKDALLSSSTWDVSCAVFFSCTRATTANRRLSPILFQADSEWRWRGDAREASRPPALAPGVVDIPEKLEPPDLIQINLWITPPAHNQIELKQGCAEQFMRAGRVRVCFCLLSE